MENVGEYYRFTNVLKRPISCRLWYRLRKSQPNSAGTLAQSYEQKDSSDGKLPGDLAGIGRLYGQ